MKHIASRENPHFKSLKKLCQSGRERRKTGRVLLDGMHLIEGYVQHCGVPEEIVVSERGAQRLEIARYLESGNAGKSVSVLTDVLFDDLAIVETPSGIMAVVMQPRCSHGFNQEIDAVLLDGMHLIESYVQHCGVPEEIVVSERGAQRREIAHYLENGNAGKSVSVLTDVLFDDLAIVETPSGIMAVVMQPRCSHGFNQEIDAVLLDGIQDPGNLGSILRSAAAAGFRQVLLSTDCAQAWSPKTLRAAMGAHFLLDIHESCDLPAFLGGYRGQAVLTALDACVALYSLDLKEPVAWVFGNEGQGVRPEVAESTPSRVRIPMPGATESLNVAAAVAVCLFETVRQRQTL